MDQRKNQEEEENLSNVEMKYPFRIPADINNNHSDVVLSAFSESFLNQELGDLSRVLALLAKAVDKFRSSLVIHDIPQSITGEH